MNLYDKICIQCVKCNEFIGEADWDAKITIAVCGKCGKTLEIQ